MIKIILLVANLTPNMPVAVWSYSDINMERCIQLATNMVELAPKIGHQAGYTCRVLHVEPRKGEE